MAIVTFSEAATVLGFKSRSTLYRLRDQGDLASYLRPPASTGGAPRLELEPPGLPPLRLHVERNVRPQVNNMQRHTRVRIDPRWEEVAASLTNALAEAGGLQLAAAEAKAIAAALPEALADGFGESGLELLRAALVKAGCWRAGVPAGPDPDADRAWWSEWGRWEPEQPLDPDEQEFWQHVAQMVAGMMAPSLEITGPNADELFYQLRSAIDSVCAGGRFDQERWDAATARMFLSELACDPTDADAAGELAKLLEAGQLGPELQAEAAAALERYQQLEQQVSAAAA